MDQSEKINGNVTGQTDTKNQNQSQEPEFSIQQLYLKDLSFESPKAPKIFLTDWKPELSLEITNKHQVLEKDIYEVVLMVTVTVSREKETVFVIEVQQSGIFLIRGLPQENLGHTLNSFCPSILFPYAREVVSDVATRGGFPQLLLAPVNFEALYMQQLEKQAKAGKSASNDNQ